MKLMQTQKSLEIGAGVEVVRRKEILGKKKG